MGSDWEVSISGAVCFKGSIFERQRSTSFVILSAFPVCICACEWRHNVEVNNNCTYDQISYASCINGRARTRTHLSASLSRIVCPAAASRRQVVN